MSGVGNYVIILLIIGVSFTLLFTITANYLSYAEKPFQNAELNQISDKVVEMQNKSQNLTTQLSGALNSSSASSNPTDNPLAALSVSVFSIVPFLFEMLLSIPFYILSFLQLLPFTIPSFITSTIILVILLVFILMLLDWVRGGLQSLIR